MNSLALRQERNFFAQELKMNKNNLTQSCLRADTVLNSGSGFDFNFSATKNTANPSEMLLEQNDAFIVTAIGLTIKKLNSATASALNALHCVALDYNYVNKTTGIFDGTNDANIQAIFNGKLGILIDNVFIFPSIPARVFQRVPTSQQGQVNAAIAGPSTYTQPRDGFENAMFGYYFVEPFVLKGDGKNYAQIDTGESYTYSEANETNFATCLFIGYLAQNENSVGLAAGRF